jgi:hypothetical protein
MEISRECIFPRICSIVRTSTPFRDMAHKDRAGMKEQIDHLAQDMDEFRELMQSMQIRLNNLSSQLITNLAILIQHRQYLQLLEY